MHGSSERGSRVDALIPKWPMSQSVFLVTVRHSYAGGMTIADSFDFGIQTVIAQYPDFEARFAPELHDLPDWRCPPTRPSRSRGGGRFAWAPREPVGARATAPINPRDAVPMSAACDQFVSLTP